jgi:hypothetical protein
MRSSKEELTIMRFISTAAHGLADYSVSFIVVGFPFYYGLTGASRATFVTLGLFVIVYSLLTDYELGLVRPFAFVFTCCWTHYSASPRSRPRQCSTSRMMVAFQST